MPSVPTTSPEYFDPPDLSRLPNVGNAPLPANADPSAARALMQNFASGVAPAAAGVGAFEPGAAVGAGIGAFAGLGVADEVTVPLFSLIGGTITSGLASAGTAKVQQVGADALTGGGYSATLAADQAAHPYASFAGDLASQLPFMRPSMSWAVKARAAGAGIGGGIEAGREYVNDNGQLDPYRIGMATGFGAALDRNTGLGDAVMAPGNALISRIATGPGATMARIGADDVVDNSAAELNLDPAAIAQRADAIGETHPNLSPATRMAYAKTEAIAAAAGPHITPDETAARNVVEGDAQVEASNPFTGPNAAQDHGERLAVATQSLLAGVPMPDMNAPLQAPMPQIATTDLHAAVLHVESHGNAGAISPKGARGLMQVMPGTQGDPGYGVPPLPPNATPDQVRAQGDAYLDAMVAHYGGDQTLGIAAYNGGPGNVDHWLKTIGDPRAGGITDAQFADRIPVPETRDYVKKVYAAAGHDIPQSPIVSPDALAAAGPEVADPPASAEQYVDRYLAGAGRGDSPADLEMQQFAASNGPDIEAEFNRRVANPDFQPVETPQAQGGVTQGEAASTPTGAPQASPEPLFDPTPYLPALKDYVAARQGSLQPEAVAAKLGLEVAEARRVLGTLAATRDSGLTIGASGVLRRQPVRQGPVDVATFLADRGGIRNDEGHDLVKGRGLQKFVPGAGPLIRPTGMSIDAAGELLHDARYFPVERPTENEVLQLLERAGREKVYKPDEAAQVAGAAHEGQMAAAEQRARVDIHAATRDLAGGFSDAETETALHFMATGDDLDAAIEHTLAAHALERLRSGAIETDKSDYDIPGFDDRSTISDTGLPGAGSSEAGTAGEGSRGVAGDTGGREAPGRAAAVDPGQPEPRLKAFDEPIGKGVKAQADAIEHDLRMAVDPAIADRQRQQAELGAKAPLRKPVEQDGTMGLPMFDAADQPEFRLDAEGAQTSIKQVLDQIDSEKNAVDELRGCMKPAKGAP